MNNLKLFETPTHPELDFDHLDRMVTADCMKVLNLCQEHKVRVEQGRRYQGWVTATAAYAVALHLKKNPAEFDKLLSHPFLENLPSTRSIDKVLQYVFLIEQGADTRQSGYTDTNAYKDAKRTANQLRSDFESGTKPSELLKDIEKARGIKHLKSLIDADASVERDQDDDQADHEPEDRARPGKALLPTGDPKPARPTRGAHPTKPAPLPSDHVGDDENEAEDLSSALTQFVLNTPTATWHRLRDATEEGDEVVLTVKRGPGTDDFIEFSTRGFEVVG